MCIAIPGKVESIKGHEAIVHCCGVKIKTNIILLENVNIDDYVLVHAGCAIEKISKEDAIETLKFFNELASASQGGVYNGGS